MKKRAAICVFFALTLFAGSVPVDEYQQRRAALKKSLGDSVTILFGHSEKDHGDLRSPFFQEPNFFYLTGWTEPGAMLVLTPESEILLLPKRNTEQEKWTGPKLAPGDKDLAKLTGFKQVMPTESFEANLPKWLETSRKLFTLTRQPSAEMLRKLAPLRDLSDVAMPLARIRAIKSDAEIALVQRATDAGIDAHRSAWKMIRPGISEYQVAAAMSNSYFDSGCERHAYSPIVGSGINAATLHYSRNNRKLDTGELLLMDVGPECSMYATDITRTVPVGGKFTPRQRELYELVLGAQKAAIAAVKPGMMLGSAATKSGLHQLVVDYFKKHGKEKYFTHSLGHHVGLDVHDPNDPAVPLAPGMIITIEPGLYLPEEKIGIRIEDVILVTETGSKILSGALPREPEEIERALTH